jgi:serine/threonine-protein kinase
MTVLSGARSSVIGSGSGRSAVVNQRNAQFRVSMLQVACESALLHGHRALALEWLAAAGASTLADLDWLERCVMLEPLHGEAVYRGTVVTVQARVEAIWWR